MRMVLEAYRHVRANQGAAGIDDESIEMFEADLQGNLYKLWNRMTSGSYFPPPVKQADFNDGLLLGLKGTMAQAELHFLRGRLLGGKLNKAQKGELRHPLPVGYAYDDGNRVVMDPDAEVRGAITLVFHVFLETGSAYAVVQRFAKRSLKFPKRSYGGAWDGKLVWGNLTHCRVCELLKNPCYAGTYTYGRYHLREALGETPEAYSPAMEPQHLTIEEEASRRLKNHPEAEG